MSQTIFQVPRQLHAIPFVASFSDDSRDPPSDARNYLKLLYPDDAGAYLPSAVAAGTAQDHTSSAGLVLGEVAALLGHYCVSVQDGLKDQIKQLLALLDAVYPVADGETLQSSGVTIITQAFDRYPPGTVVYVRRTDVATIHFLLTHLFVDLSSGQTQVVGIENFPPPAARDGSLALIRSNSDSASASDFFFTIAGSLVWALPGPWGAIGSAVLGGLSLLCGGTEDLGKIIETAISAAVKQLEQYDLHLKVVDDIAVIQDFAEWLNTQIAVIGLNYKDNPIPNSFILKSGGDNGMLQGLRDKLEQVHLSIVRLEELIKGFDATDDSGFFNFYLQAISLDLLGQKMLLQLEAQVSTNYGGGTTRETLDNLELENAALFDEYNNRWRIDYSRFELAVNGDGSDTTGGFAKRVTDMIAFISKSRTDKVGDVYRFEWQEDDHQGGYVYHQGWTWKDSYTNDDYKKNFVDDYAQSCCTNIEHKDVAEANRTNWINTVKQALQDKYKDATSCTEKWKASIFEWNEHLPPMAPGAAPALDPKGWQGKPPADSHWQAGHRVAYALAFRNDKGPSTMGPYGSAQDIQPDKGATIINIPKQDDLKMATQVMIYRRITDADNAQFIKLIAGKHIGIDSFQDAGK